MERPLFSRLRAFAEATGRSGGRLFFASGRVNLLGAHIDYHGGCVLPVAIDRGIALLARPRTDRRLTVASADFPGRYDLDLDALPPASDAGFAAYPAGVAQLLRDAGRELPGCDLTIAGDLPPGAGMSSSAALLVASAMALSTLSGAPLEPLEAARLAFRAETGYVGVRCGIMDPFASALGRAGHALWLDCKEERFDYVPLPADRLAFVMLDSMTRRDLKSGAFNQRVAESKAALATLQRLLPGITCLRDVTVEQLDALRGELEPQPFQRARHVVTEVARVRRARELLLRGELLEFGQLMWLSHLSSRHLYEVSTPRLDALHEIALGHPGCYGARLTGAGFGGCALAVVHPRSIESFCAHVVAGFEQRFGQRPEIHPLAFGQAPGEVIER